MKKNFGILAMTLFLFATSQAQMELPAPSPAARVMQVVGNTEIGIDYYSPGVKGREGKIWGELVAYDKAWRMGANSGTDITFSHDVKINGKELKAGTYCLGTIPGKEKWILIFNTEKSLGGWGGHDESKDALRVEVIPNTKAANSTERLNFQITDFNNEKATISMKWERVKMSFEVEVSTDEQAWNSIQSVLNPSWRQYASAARYAMDDREDYKTALEWINKSVELKQGWYNTWLQATVYNKMNNTKEALKSAQMAMDLGLAAEKEGQNFFYKSTVEEALKTWAAKK